MNDKGLTKEYSIPYVKCHSTYLRFPANDGRANLPYLSVLSQKWQR